MKKIIIIQTIFGLTPFFLEEIFLLLNLKNFESYYLQKISFLYGALIVSFLNGMQWQRFIANKETSFLKMNIPMIIFLWTWTYSFNSFLNPTLIIISGLCITLVTDIIFQRNLIDFWFLKLRLIVTLIAIISFI